MLQKDLLEYRSTEFINHSIIEFDKIVLRYGHILHVKLYHIKTKMSLNIIKISNIL